MKPPMLRVYLDSLHFIWDKTQIKYVLKRETLNHFVNCLYLLSVWRLIKEILVTKMSLINGMQVLRKYLH